MSAEHNHAIGMIGFGQIGASLFDRLRRNPAAGIEVRCILESDPDNQASIPSGLAVHTIDDLLADDTELIVEAAHPSVVALYGEQILQSRDLLIMSVSALGDADLEEKLCSAGKENGTKLYIPHGATLGLDGLRDGLSIWEEVSITMRKHPRNLNFDACPQLRPPEGAGTEILYDGPTREVLPLFPKNVNSHATLALATLGMDQTRSILIADSDLEESIIEINAQGGGTSIHIERRNPIKGVTGQLTILSVLESIHTALGSTSVFVPC